MDEKQLKNVAAAAIDAANAELYALSNDIWSNPEMNFKEYHAHKILCNFLEKRNFKVHRSFHLETAFKAEYGNGSINVVLICEYDALPAIGHGCGHNLIAEIGIAAALGAKAALDAFGKDLIKITVLGTPAEEDWGGKINLIQSGAFQDVSVALMSHPAPNSIPRPVIISIVSVTVTYHGRATHAAMSPWEGINALDAAVIAYQAISNLRQQMKPDWRIHGVFKKGGDKPNIIPDLAELEFFIRAPRVEELEGLQKRVSNIFESAATATGCRVEFLWQPVPFYDLITNCTLIELYEKNARNMGTEFCTDEAVMRAPGGSTDMGNVSHVVPSIHPLYRIGKASNHSREFTEIAGSKEAQETTLKEAKVLAFMVVDLLLNPSLVDAARKEFEATMSSRRLTTRH